MNSLDHTPWHLLKLRDPSFYTVEDKIKPIESHANYVDELITVYQILYALTSTQEPQLPNKANGVCNYGLL